MLKKLLSEIKLFKKRQRKIPKFILLQLLILHHFGLIKNGQCGDFELPFCYDDVTCSPPSWGGTCLTGRKQSPVNLESWRVKKIPKSVNLVLSREYAQFHSFYLWNNGVSVSVFLNNEETSQCMVRGSNFLPDEPWYFSSLHFHWGTHDFVGSEHAINGQHFPLELHMIHRQPDKDGIAVFGILYKLSDYDNLALSPIIDNLQYVQTAAPLKPSEAYYPLGQFINLTELIPKKIKVFRYNGSLTTPPCTEGVIWTVFHDIQTVSRRQLMEFRKLLQSDGRPLLKNHRHVQPTFTEERKVVYYMKTIVPTSGGLKKKKG